MKTKFFSILFLFVLGGIDKSSASNICPLNGLDNSTSVAQNVCVIPCNDNYNDSWQMVQYNIEWKKPNISEFQSDVRKYYEIIAEEKHWNITDIFNSNKTVEEFLSETKDDFKKLYNDIIESLPKIKEFLYDVYNKTVNFIKNKFKSLKQKNN